MSAADGMPRSTGENCGDDDEVEDATTVGVLEPFELDPPHPARMTRKSKIQIALNLLT